MSKYKSDIINTLVDRGFLHQCTDIEALDRKASEGMLTGYIGFDCTADSLHVGSLVQIMMLRHFQKAGHKPIVLMGGGTTKLGDPSFKDESRPMLSEEKIASNISGIQQVFSKFLDFGEDGNQAIMVNNDDWLSKLNYIDFLREYGVHFTVNRMMSFESVKLRLDREQPLTFLEFNYMILQGYDFLELFRRHNCTVQLSGADQWGNVINGIELGRRVDQAELYGFTSPLITTSSGEKMGKSVGGAVWLNAERLSAYDYWQFWRNTGDADVICFLKLFTDLPLAEIAKLESLEGAELNQAKVLLANEATTLAHGAEAAAEAEATAKRTFEQGGAGDNLPTVEISGQELENGVSLINLLREAGLSSSNGDARRLIKGGGAKINDEKAADENVMVSNTDLNDDGVIKLSAGKKRHAIVRPV
jgi:tyrosyl-tRNA synthetase